MCKVVLRKGDSLASIFVASSNRYLMPVTVSVFRVIKSCLLSCLDNCDDMEWNNEMLRNALLLNEILI